MSSYDFYVADFQHVSLMEYPGKISSIVFTHGCSLRCRYCHNPELVTGRAKVSRLQDFLEYLAGKDIEAVAVTGGEPLLAPHLSDFLADMKERGLKVKLDTNGFSVNALERVCSAGLADYAAVDMKAFSQNSLKRITRTDADLNDFFRSVEILDKYSVSYEVRHTLWEVPDEDDVAVFADRVPDCLFFLQRIRNAKMLDKTFDVSGLDNLKAEEILKKYIRNFGVRG
ncbi:MAG: anaerobic ribonucleoside-triphosphate reductase activating protein [Deferribacterales bacterium]